tara:strand:+ start:67 stop:336 length:270 start_codon:yes stop_codon:yes gene_type:complete
MQASLDTAQHLTSNARHNVFALFGRERPMSDKPKSKVNEAGNYTKPGMRKKIFSSIKAGGKGGKPGQWSARKAQMLAKRYKARGGGYKN